MKRANEYKIYKKLELTSIPMQHYFNIVDIDVTTGRYLGFYTKVNNDGNEILLDGCSLLKYIELVLR